MRGWFAIEGRRALRKAEKKPAKARPQAISEREWLSLDQLMARAANSSGKVEWLAILIRRFLLRRAIPLSATKENMRIQVNDHGIVDIEQEEPTPEALFKLVCLRQAIDKLGFVLTKRLMKELEQASTTE